MLCTVLGAKEIACGWRLARWAVPFEEEGIFLMKHTFTGEVVRLTAEEFAEPEKADNSFNAQCIMHNAQL